MCLHMVTKNAIPFTNIISMATDTFLCDHIIESGIIWGDLSTWLGFVSSQVSDQLSNLSFVRDKHETHCQIAISWFFFSFSYLFLVLYHSQDSFLSIQHQPEKHILSPTWQYGWQHPWNFWICPFTLDMTCSDPVLLFAIYLCLQTMPVLGPFVIGIQGLVSDCLE